MKKVVFDSPAATAGLRVGDVLSTINGRQVTSAKMAAAALRDAPIGMISIVLKRERPGFSRSASVDSGGGSEFERALPACAPSYPNAQFQARVPVAA